MERFLEREKVLKLKNNYYHYIIIIKTTKAAKWHAWFYAQIYNYLKANSFRPPGKTKLYKITMISPFLK